MADDLIHPDLVEVALDRATGTAFEQFVNNFYPSLAGINFVPLGGIHDGGADAVQDQSIWADQKPGIFYQASIQKEHRGKIRQTVKRLKEVKRAPTALYFISSQRVSKIDAEERFLSDETGVSIRIRDRAYIAAQINDSIQTRNAFRTYLGPFLDLLKRIGSAQIIKESPHVRSPAVYVFLRQEIERRGGNQRLPEALVDSLILWALEGTDPDQNKFKNRAEIVSTIEAALPFGRMIIGAHLDSRLAVLAAKNNPTGREIRHHQKQGLYCLPFETRLKVQEENAADETLHIKVRTILEDRIVSTSAESLQTQDCTLAAEIALRTLQLTFEREGLEFCAFLEDKRNYEQYPSVADNVDMALLEHSVTHPKAESYKEAILEALRGTFYKSTPEERLFLSKLAHTYSLLFGLQAEPRIAQYFEEMASDCYLYVGADLIVRALSERYVRNEDQRVRTLLKMAVDAGSKLFLTEPVLDEVLQHLISTGHEFRTYFAAQESKITYQMARNCSKILIRAYFYARLDPPEGMKPPASWSEYLHQFCDPGRLTRPDGKEDLRKSLLAMFRMEYESRDEIESLINTQQARETLYDITGKLTPHKPTEAHARNDALMAVATYGRRQKNGESAKPTVFGYRTWWLTGESMILQHTGSLVSAHGARYMMRPEFLLNFIAMAPRLSEIRAAYRNIFPSLLGIRFSDRIKEEVYRDMMKKVNEAANLEFGRVEALVSKYSDNLKSDFRRIYKHRI